MNISKAVGLILLVGAVLFVVALVNVGNHAVDVVANQANQPDSATDLIMRSRETAPVEPGNRQGTIWLGAGLLALGVVISGGAVFLLRGGAEFLRQWRLVQKRPQHHPTSPRWSTVRDVTVLPDWSDDMAVRPVRRLPDGGYDETMDSPYLD